MRRPDEEFCRISFDALLTSRGFDAQWSDDHTDPPDYFLSCGHHRVAVEVTTVSHKYTTTTGRQVSEIGIAAGVRDLCKEIQREALKRGILRGLYAVGFNRGYDEFHQARKEAAELVLGFIQSTMAQETATSGRLKTANGLTFDVEKLGTAKDAVCELMISGAAGWEGDVVDELAGYIQAAIAEKASNPGIQALADPAVLLLLDRYHMADGEMMESVAKRVSAVPKFAAVYVIADGGKVCCIYQSQSLDACLGAPSK